MPGQSLSRMPLKPMSRHGVVYQTSGSMLVILGSCRLSWVSCRGSSEIFLNLVSAPHAILLLSQINSRNHLPSNSG